MWRDEKYYPNSRQHHNAFEAAVRVNRHRVRPGPVSTSQSPCCQAGIQPGVLPLVLFPRPVGAAGIGEHSNDPNPKFQIAERVALGLALEHDAAAGVSREKEPGKEKRFAV